MNRRAFLSTLAAGLAGAALDPERLLWVPGQKTIFLPAVVPASLVTSDIMNMIVREGLRVLQRDLVPGANINRSYADLVTARGYSANIIARVRQA